MPTPSVDVVSGQVTNPPIEDGQPFVWTCPENTGSISVTAQDMPGGKPWFTPSPISFTAPGPSAEVTAKGVSPPGGWSYVANVNTDHAKIQVESSRPAHAKAS
jgi:hypothetical protein